MADRLTARQRRFCLAYVGEARFNAAEAARLAGYSPRTARSTACKLMQLPKVRAEIQRLMEEENERLGYSLTRVIREFVDIGVQADIARFITTDGEMVTNLDGLPTHLIKSFKTREFKGVITREIVLHDRVDALKTLLKSLGGINDRLEITGPNGGPIDLARFDPTTMSTPELEALVQRLQEMRRDRG